MNLFRAKLPGKAPQTVKNQSLVNVDLCTKSFLVLECPIFVCRHGADSDMTKKARYMWELMFSLSAHIMPAFVWSDCFFCMLQNDNNQSIFLCVCVLVKWLSNLWELGQSGEEYVSSHHCASLYWCKLKADVQKASRHSSYKSSLLEHHSELFERCLWLRIVVYSPGTSRLYFHHQDEICIIIVQEYSFDVYKMVLVAIHGDN